MSDNQLSNFASIMSRLYQRIMILDRTEKMCYGVTLSQAFVIDALSRNKTLTMNELSHQLGLALSTLTRIVDILVRDEIVTRCQTEGDRRRVCVRLTRKGINLSDKLDGCSLRFWGKVFSALPEGKNTQVMESMKYLLKALNEAESNCCRKR